MITKLIIENLEKELKDRDKKIFSLKEKNEELELIKSDWIDKEMSENKTEFPKNYIKQKKEHARAITHYWEEIKKSSEIIAIQEKRHQEEIDLLNFEIEMLRKRKPKRSIRDILKRK